jgi:hypothetical protein
MRNFFIPAHFSCLQRYLFILEYDFLVYLGDYLYGMIS